MKDILNPSSTFNPYSNGEEFFLYSVLCYWDFRNYMCINFKVISIQQNMSKACCKLASKNIFILSFLIMIINVI